MARGVKSAIQSLIQPPTALVQSDPVTRTRMDLEHALIGAGGSVMQSRSVVKTIDALIIQRIKESK